MSVIDRMEALEGAIQNVISEMEKSEIKPLLVWLGGYPGSALDRSEVLLTEADFRELAGAVNLPMVCEPWPGHFGEDVQRLSLVIDVVMFYCVTEM